MFLRHLIRKRLVSINVIVEEELDCIDINDIVNLEGSPSLVFIDEECGNLIVVNDGGELIRNKQKKKSDVLHSLEMFPNKQIKCCRREYLCSNHVEYLLSISYVSMIFLEIFFYYRANNLKDRKLFSDQMNRNRFDSILARHNWSCSTMYTI